MTTSEFLNKELQTFEANRSELMATAEGKFALVFDEAVAGTFNDEEDAITEGYKKFGNVPFLVKQISAVESPANFVNAQIGF